MTDDQSFQELVAVCRREADRVLAESPSFLQRTDEQAEASKERHIAGLAQSLRQVPLQRARARARWGWVTAAAAVCVLVGLGSLVWSIKIHPRVARQPVQVVKVGAVSAGALSAGAVSAGAVSAGAVPVGALPTALLRRVVGKVLATRAGGTDLVAQENVAIADGDELSTTAEASATVELDDTRVELSKATTLQISDTTPREQRMHLRAGRVDVSAPKLPKGETRSLEVITPDSRVVVRGTIFSVEVDEGDDGLPVTRVFVTRGAVSVLHGGGARLVAAGQAWSSQPEQPEGDEPPLAVNGRAAPAKPQAHAPPPSRTSVDLRGRDRAGAAVSSLTQQNRMFELGVASRNQGNLKNAAFWFDRLLRKYPNSPLSASAHRELQNARERLKATTR